MSEFPAQPERSGVWRPAARRRPPLRQDRTLPPELAAFSGLLDAALLERAARRARRLGVGGDEVLRCAGVLAPDRIAAAIAAELGLALDPLDRPFEHEQPPLDAACAGVLVRRDGDGDETGLTVAARGTGIRWLAARIAADPEARDGLRIAAPERLAAYVREAAAAELAAAAAYGLRARRRDLSAARYGWSALHNLAILSGAGLAAAAVLAPDVALIAGEYFLAACFVSWTLLRLASCLFPRQETVRLSIADRFLPVYTVIVALYREAPVVAKLVAALRELRYPPEKLDIKLVVEGDDRETRAALARLGLHAPFEIIVAPKAGPQTKPKALAAALPFARGSFVTVYDAEDEPDPDQLRAALAAFALGPPDLACVQAKLVIDNAADNWFTRQFTAEYAGQFDVFLPALARLGLPLPLGGTSNHFRTRVLREVGGWDPFNVTEDADLGMRLARFGHRTGVIDSTTWEEAPVNLVQWLRQRTRWFKGWMQTWIVHMRHPLRLRREVGWRGFLALQLLVGGTVLSALVHPFFMGLVLHDLATGAMFAPGESAEHTLRKILAPCVLAIGYFGAVALGLAGLRRRGMTRFAWVLATIPLYWLLLSSAAWRALWQLVREPHRWEKTRHGLARSSLRRRPCRGGRT